MLCDVGSCSILFPKVYEFFDATVHKFPSKTLKTTAHTFSFWSCLHLRTSFSESASVALVCDYKFWPNNDDF